MYSNNKLIRDVANIAAQIMSGQQPVTEKLHANQQQLDVHEPEKDELTADDFKKLRGKKEVKKEEVEELDELSKNTLHSYVKKSFSDKEKENLNTPERQKGLRKATSRLYKEDEKLDEEDAYEKDRYAVKNGKAVKDNPTHQGSPNYKDQPHHVYATSAENALKNHTKKEEVELDEVKMADLPSTKVQGRSYGSSRPEPHALDVMKGPTEKQLLGVQAEKKKKKFSEMVNLYQEKGLKSLSEMLVKEEPDNEQFTKELEDAKAKSEGKKKNTEIAKGSVQAVKQEEVEELDELSTPTLASYVKKVGHEGAWTKKRTAGVNSALNKVKQNSMKSEEMDIDAINGVRMHTFKERFGDRDNNN